MFKCWHKGQIKGAELTAICSSNESRIEWVKTHTNGDVKIFRDQDSFFNDSGIDAVLIATPHYSHPDLAIKAFAKGKHVLIEKPAGVFTKNVMEMNEAAKASGKVFGIMYNQRANPLYQRNPRACYIRSFRQYKTDELDYDGFIPPTKLL